MPTDANMKIITVDDFSTMRRIIKNLLRQLGFQNVVEAEDGASGLEMVRQEKVDLIISDWNMPRMTGLEFLQEVRNDPSLKDIPFIMITAEAEKEKIIQAVQSGVSNFIVKPFTAEILRQKINKVFDG
ncbi:chemotaxis response regulator CheY [bacterium]|nr:chemotaxis response regulator CheY [bacterium]